MLKTVVSNLLRRVDTTKGISTWVNFIQQSLDVVLLEILTMLSARFTLQVLLYVVENVNLRPVYYDRPY